MLFAFLSLVQSFAFASDILHLTDLPPNDGKPYFVMVHSDGCGHCQRLAPAFCKAAELGEGFATYAELNCNVNKTACLELRIEGVPRLFHFYNGIIHPYEGTQLSRVMANWASLFINDTALLVDADNYTENAGDNVAILFTSKSVIPKIWAGVERTFNNSNVKFLVSRDEKLKEKLGLESFPGIYAKKGNTFTLFKDTMQIKKIVQFLHSIFAEKSEL